jgi:L-iditol 2-dehydrogenase
VIYAVDLVENRRHLASKLGADVVLDPGMSALQTVLKQTNNLGVDHVIVATGNPKALESALGIVRKGGRVLLFGAPARGSRLSLDLSRLFLRELTLMSSYSSSELEMRMALQLIEHKRIDTTQMLTHRFPLDRLLEAFHVAQNARMAGKIIIMNT